ncbi:MAG: Bax inhibitor-1/YccA family protein [Lachnospiraceae bacterium]|nr:Bax inhibitor-1/YccA family protein [Lachnospiraceae bacterium]
MDNQNQNPYSNNNYYGNNGNYNGYNQNYNNNMNYNQGYNQNYNNNMNYNQGYNQNYNNNMNYNQGYNQDYNNNMNYNQGYNQNYNNNNFNNMNPNAGYYQDYNVGSPQPMTSKQLKYLTIPEVVSRSFLFMFAALLITAFAAFTTSFSTAISLLSGGTFYVLLFVEIAIVLVSNYAIRKNNVILAGILYAAYSYLTGMIMSVIFLVYSMSSIATVFLVTALIFAIMAVYGMVTKKDLSSVGSLCFMGLLGIIIAGLVNLILMNTILDTVICCVGVLIFVGLTAYDVQKIKNRANSATNESVTALALFGGFELYLDFVNLFLKLLRLFGSSRD